MKLQSYTTLQMYKGEDNTNRRGTSFYTPLKLDLGWQGPSRKICKLQRWSGVDCGDEPFLKLFPDIVEIQF